MLCLHLLNELECLGHKTFGITNRQLSKVLRLGKGTLCLIYALYHQVACRISNSFFIVLLNLLFDTLAVPKFC
jgi:hypothetical protein